MATYEATFRTDTVLLVEKINASNVVEAFKKAMDMAKGQNWILISVKVMV